jgi:CRISPR/Cas system CSM-associated protein Csm3 (group 7 of RAMP superfamily)
MMTKMYKVEIRYSFKPDFTVRVGSGQSKHGIIDNAYRTRLDSERREKITIPGTTVKGRIRYTFERLQHLFPNIDKDMTVRIFGDSGLEGWARFSDLSIDEKENAFLDTQTSTTIDRFRKTAKAKTLRIQEFVMLEAEKCFYGTIEGYIQLENEASFTQELAYFLLAIMNTQSFGGSKSVGFGKGVTKLISVKIGSLQYESGTIKEKIEQLLA